uniref:Ion_trans_2 domain-containing protein n=1 Tax=Syphacia muris TaxID=451379 RepID=A0A0N5ARB1_9BILA
MNFCSTLVDLSLNYSSDGNIDKLLDSARADLIRKAVSDYENKIGVHIKEPVREHTHWDIWGGVYYSASLYTTIGYGNFHPETNAGRIVSMVYAFCGIPLVFTIMFEWGFLYFSWLEIFWRWFNQKVFVRSQEALIRRRLEQERTRRAGCQMSLRTTSTPKFAEQFKEHEDAAGHSTDHQIESGKRIAQLEIELSEAEKQRTVPLKAALAFFFTWILISAAVVRLWETNWSYFTAYYYFFTSLTTIGLGDVVTEYPQYVIFNMILTMIGLSVVGLCLAIVQSKIRLIFDRMSRSIDSQYRIRQIDPDVATMTIIPNEKEGIKRLCEAQPLQDRIIFIAMDEHKKALLEERWKQKSSLVNKVTQTWPKIADKCIQTGQRVDEQPRMPRRRDPDDDNDSDDESYSDESGAEYDDCGRRIVPPSNLRYIYTVFD